jgi:hypothetical protein
VVHGNRPSPTGIGVYRSGARHSFSSGARGPECTTERGQGATATGGGTEGRARRSAPRPAACRKGAAKTPGRRFHQRRPRRRAGGLDTHHEVSGPVQRCRPRTTRRDERTCTTMRAACFCDVLQHAWRWKTRGDTRFHIPRLRGEPRGRCDAVHVRQGGRIDARRGGEWGHSRPCGSQPRRATAHPRLVPWVTDHERSRGLLDQARRLRCFAAERIRWTYRTWGGAFSGPVWWRCPAGRRTV